MDSEVIDSIDSTGDDACLDCSLIVSLRGRAIFTFLESDGLSNSHYLPPMTAC